MAIATYSGAAGAITEAYARDLSPLAIAVANMDSPVLARLLSKGVEEVASTKIEWQDYTFRPTAFTTGAAHGTAAATTLTLTAAPSTNLRVGTLLRPRHSQEILQVTAVTSNQITVVRGFSGTTAAAIPSGSSLDVAGYAALERNVWADQGQNLPTQRFNFVQNLDETFEISGLAASIKLAAGLEAMTNWVQQQEMMKLKQALQVLARSVLYAGAPAATTQGSASVRANMDGAVEMIRTGAAAGSGAIYLDMTSTQVDVSNGYQNLIGLMKLVWDVGGRPNICAIGSDVKAAIDWHKQNARTDVSITQVSYNVQRLETSFGTFDFMLDSNVRRGDILLLDDSKIRVKAAPGRQFQTKEMGLIGDLHQFMIIGSYTVEIMGAAIGAHGYGYNAV